MRIIFLIFFIAGIPFFLKAQISDQNIVIKDVKAQFPNGESAQYQYFVDHLKYPKDAIKEDKSGLVEVSFTVDTSGKVCNPVINQTLFPSIDSEVIRLISQMPKWIPATEFGKAVSTKCKIRLWFQTMYGEGYILGFSAPLEAELDKLDGNDYFSLIWGLLNKLKKQEYDQIIRDIDSIHHSKPEYIDLWITKTSVLLIQKKYVEAFKSCINAVHLSKKYPFKLQYSDFYMNLLLNRLLGAIYDQDSKKAVTAFPKYPTGIQAFQAEVEKELVYPQDAMKEEIGGYLYFLITIDSDGNMIENELLNSLYPSIDTEAKRLMSIIPTRFICDKNSKTNCLSKTLISIDFQLHKQEYYKDIKRKDELRKLKLYNVTEETPRELDKVIAFQKRQQYKKAHQEIDRLIKSNPTNIDFLAYKGLIFAEQNKPQKACATFFAAQELGDKYGYSETTTRNGITLLLGKYCRE